MRARHSAGFSTLLTWTFLLALPSAHPCAAQPVHCDDCIDVPPPPAYAEFHVGDSPTGLGAGYIFPERLSLTLGGTVRWVNTGSIPHHIVSLPGTPIPIDSGILLPPPVGEDVGGDSYCFQLNNVPLDPDGAKAVPFMCLLHQQEELGMVVVFDPALSVSPSTSPPLTLILNQSHPNPAPRFSSLSYEIPPPGGMVELQVYDVNGRLVRTLVKGEQAPGHHELVWRGDKDDGSPAPAGVYWYQLRHRGQERRHQAVLVD